MKFIVKNKWWSAIIGSQLGMSVTEGQNGGVGELGFEPHQFDSVNLITGEVFDTCS